jgi:hypothetical protein
MVGSLNHKPRFPINHQALPRGLETQPSGGQMRFSDLKKSIRIRTKNGYQYLSNGEGTGSSRFISEQGERSGEEASESSNRERLDIVKIYDRLANGKKREGEEQASLKTKNTERQKEE